MVKKIILVFGFLLLLSGIVFANDENEEIYPKNTVTIDTGLLLYTPIFWGISDFSYHFIGTALQYERQISKNISLAGLVGYRGLYIFDTDYYGDDYKTIMSAISLEGHCRYYPNGETFFLDGMLGYANFYYLASYGTVIESNSNYFKFGGKIGWRIDFGKPGGFVLEPSFGYYGVIGKTNIRFIEDDSYVGLFFDSLLNQTYDYLIKGFFVGGPQGSLMLGYRF